MIHQLFNWPKIMKFVRSRTLAVITLSCLIWVVSWLFSSPTLALTAIKLFDLGYRDCPPEFAEGMVASGSSATANCFLITGKAENKSGKPVVNADVFGRVYDANDEPIMQNRTRLGSIERVPPGTSDFELRISVAANQPTPLKFGQFRASGFTGKVRR